MPPAYRALRRPPSKRAPPRRRTAHRGDRRRRGRRPTGVSPLARAGASPGAPPYRRVAHRAERRRKGRRPSGIPPVALANASPRAPPHRRAAPCARRRVARGTESPARRPARRSPATKAPPHRRAAPCARERVARGTAPPARRPVRRAPAARALPHWRAAPCARRRRARGAAISADRPPGRCCRLAAAESPPPPPKKPSKGMSSGQRPGTGRGATVQRRPGASGGSARSLGGRRGRRRCVVVCPDARGLVGCRVEEAAAARPPEVQAQGLMGGHRGSLPRRVLVSSPSHFDQWTAVVAVGVVEDLVDVVGMAVAAGPMGPLLKRSGDMGWGTTVKCLSGLSLCVCVRTCFVGCLSKAPLFPSRTLLK